MNGIHRFITFVTKPIVFLHLILLIQLAIFAGTTLQPYTMNVPGRTYLYLQGHLIYSSLIREAKDGSWNITIAHTTRPTPAVYGHLFFVMLGKIAALFNIDPPIMYMISRVAAAIILFWCTWWFIKIVLPRSLHTLAIFFILALEPGPMLTAFTWNPMIWRAAIFSYYPQVVSYRHFGLPHHTLGEAVGLLFLGTFILCTRKPTVQRFILLGTLGLMGTTILPPYFIILSVCIFIPWTLYALMTKTFKKTLLPLIIAAFTIGAVVLFMRHEFAKGYPWKDFNLDEKRWVPNGEALINYVSSLLLYIPFVAWLWIQLPRFWSTWDAERKRTVILMTCWIIIPALLVPVSSFPWFPLANFRLMDGYNYAPMGVLAALGFSLFFKHMNKRPLASFLCGFLLTGVLVASAFLSYVYTTQKINDQKNLWTNVWLDNNHFKAFAFLNTVPKRSGLMIMNHFGQIVPEFAPVRSFIASTPGFVDWGERYYIATAFFSGELPIDQAQEVLNRENISYIYYGEAERYFNKTGSLYPDLLTPVFTTPTVSIYKVNSR